MASADSLNNDDNVTAPINDDEPTTSDSRIPVAAPSSSQPRKGILKRSSSHGSRRDAGLDDTLFPLRVINRHSLDTTSIDGQHQRLAPSRIPKLSVTWWEANAGNQIICKFVNLPNLQPLATLLPLAPMVIDAEALVY
jgi:hypothetical protein